VPADVSSVGEHAVDVHADVADDADVVVEDDVVDDAGAVDEGVAVEEDTVDVAEDVAEDAVVVEMVWVVILLPAVMELEQE